MYIYVYNKKGKPQSACACPFFTKTRINIKWIKRLPDRIDLG